MPFGIFWGFLSGFSGIFATIFFGSKLRFGEKRARVLNFFLQQAGFWGRERARVLNFFFWQNRSENIEEDWKVRDLISKSM